MKKYIILIIIINCIIITVSCKKKCREKDDKLTITKTGYSGGLRTDGYYFYHDASDNGNDVFMLYRNGVLLGTHPSNLKVFESGIGTELYGDAKPGWGLFKIENNNIQIDDWGNGNGCEYPVYIRSGIILNDSMFVIKEYFRTGTREDYLKLNDTFHFKQSSKSDSTQPYL